MQWTQKFTVLKCLKKSIHTQCMKAVSVQYIGYYICCLNLKVSENHVRELKHNDLYNDFKLIQPIFDSTFPISEENTSLSNCICFFSNSSSIIV